MDADALAHVLSRKVAAWFMDPQSGALSRIEDAALDGIGEPFNADPIAAQEVRESTRLNVQHWASAMLHEPGGVVSPSLAGPVVGIAREVIRRGADRAVWAAYYVAREEAWRIWMQRSFELETDPVVLSASLEQVSRSLSGWIQATLDQLTELVQREREDFAWQSHAERLAIITSVLGEDPPDLASAERGLGYRFSGVHRAAILWTDAGVPDQAALSRAAVELRRRSGSAQAISVPASSSSLWLWLGSYDLSALSTDVEALGPTIRMAMGSVGGGVDGFRRSHFDALSAQKMMLRVSHVRSAAFDDVALVHLVTQDEQAAREYAVQVLGPLLDAPEELRSAVRVLSRNACNVARTSEALFAHRNTVLNRVKRAADLLPGRWSVDSVEVAVALEIDHWLRPPARG